MARSDKLREIYFSADLIVRQWDTALSDCLTPFERRYALTLFGSDIELCRNILSEIERSQISFDLDVIIAWLERLLVRVYHFLAGFEPIGGKR